MRNRKVSRKKAKVEKLRGELSQLGNTEENEKSMKKLQSKVEKLQSQLSEAETEEE
ncbi:hypothetical protein DFO70_102423 [Cytobacillus firmus]|uniref:Uncharacterized protein n=2 Tax=Cytobacillus TaxID=2675230 RepID=A0A366K2X0_CYTFI|nr:MULTISPECIES: hypothetical protein [Cytobacillus]RBP96096.1 hypothetical protein DFO70_102423 [Cytobacillus firmus]TDX45009.1 hypothetical protein DFO72_103423 [Cytobacillus oceanisediminis]